MARGKKGKKSKKKFYLFFLIIIALSMIGFGLYLDYITSPQVLFSAALDKTIEKLENSTAYEDLTGITDNYTLTSNITYEFESQTLKNSTLPEDIEKYNLITNLQTTTNQLKITQDKTNKKLFVTVNSTLPTEELINAKLLVENSTEYYQVNGIVDTYVNNGNNNYFEALTDSTTSKTNLITVLKSLSQSIKNNLLDDYFLVKQEKVEINNRNKYLTKVSFELNNTLAKKIVNNVLKDLKQDEQSNKILTALYEDFKNVSLDSKTTILKSNERININLYTDFFGNVEKYEFIFSQGNEEKRLIYITETQEAYYSENNRVVYNINCDISEDKITLKFSDTSGEEQGKFSYDNTTERLMISLNIKYKEKTIDMLYDSKIENISKGTSYDNSISYTMKIMNNNELYINANIKLENTVSSDLTIEEDVSTAIFASSVTEEQKTMLDQKVDNVFTRLKS